MGFVRSVSPMLVLGVWNLGVGRTGVCRVGDRKPVPPHATFFRFPGCSMGPFGPPTAAPTTSSSSVSPHLCTCTCISGLGARFCGARGCFPRVLWLPRWPTLTFCSAPSQRSAAPLLCISFVAAYPFLYCCTIIINTHVRACVAVEEMEDINMSLEMSYMGLLERLEGVNQIWADILQQEKVKPTVVCLWMGGGWVVCVCVCVWCVCRCACAGVRVDRRCVYNLCG